MSHTEVLRWIDFRQKHGPLNPLHRFDAAIARAVAPFVKGDKKLLMPWPKEDEQAASLEDVMGILKFSAKAKKSEQKVNG